MREVYYLYHKGEHILTGSQVDCSDHMERMAHAVARHESKMDNTKNYDDVYIKHLTEYKMEEK